MDEIRPRATVEVEGALMIAGRKHRTGVYWTTRTAVTSWPSALPTKWIARRDFAFCS